MHDIRKLRQDAEQLRLSLLRKGFEADMDTALKYEEERRLIIVDGEKLKAELNKASKAIGLAKREGRDAAEEMEAARQIRDQISELDDKKRDTEKALNDLLLTWPNEPAQSAPDGKDASENPIYRDAAEFPTFDFKLKDHLELAEGLGILDMPRGGKITGSGWPVYVGLGATLERALINFMIDLHTREHGYREMYVPFAVNADSALGTGQLPKFPEDMYYIERDNLYLIPTAEVPVTNLHRDELLDNKELPLKYAAYTACFRREAGAHGADTRGLLRMHQFNKVELVQVCEPEKSEEAHQEILSQATRVLDMLGITYRIIELCTGDLSFGAAKCYDIEVWSPASENWLEASSVSNFHDFQARRMNLRYRPKSDGSNKGPKSAFPHTLNGSGLATSRVMVALMETYQTPEGRIRIPRVLQPYMGNLDQISGPTR